MALRHPANITQLRWWGCIEAGVEAVSFQIPGCHVQSQLSYLTEQEMKSWNKKTQKKLCYRCPQHRGYTKRDPRMVCSWGHSEFSWHCCNMDAHFHYPHSAMLLNLSHITLLTPSKWQTFAKVLKHNSTISSFCIPSVACHQSSMTAALTSQNNTRISGDSSKKRACSSLEVMPCEVKAVRKGSGSQVTEEVIKCQTPDSTKWQWILAKCQTILTVNWGVHGAVIMISIIREWYNSHQVTLEGHGEIIKKAKF